MAKADKVRGESCIPVCIDGYGQLLMRQRDVIHKLEERKQSLKKAEEVGDPASRN